MTEFSSLVSKFAHAKYGEGTSDQANGANRNGKKRVKSEDVGPAEEEAFTEELSTQVRKSLRLSTSTSTPRPLTSRTVRADSIKTRPHHKRLVTEVVKKEVKQEVIETKVRVKAQGRNPGYSAPAVYAHLSLLPDIIDYDLDVLFVGINPGVRSSERSHHFAGPTNHFWPCLSDSGLLPPGVRLGPDDDTKLPALCNMGLTNLVDRPSRMGTELSVAECRAAAPVLTAKIKKYRPRFVCFVSKQAWDMYSGVGLGLQTAWVSWYDEPEDVGVIGVSGQDMKEEEQEEGTHAIQNNLDSQGYRMAPYFEKGPSAEKLKEELDAEGVHTTTFFKNEEEMQENDSLKAEDEEEDDKKKSVVKMEADEIRLVVKPEVDDEKSSLVKLEDAEDVKVKADQIEAEYASAERQKNQATQRQQQAAKGPSSSNYPVYRGGVRGSRMFVMPSTSGRVTQYRKEDKLAYFKQLAELVRKDRRLRGVKDPWA
ncbi:hypothetical protein BGX28_008693 [Mortierella sp. GBA30]|nr:hypothetical protein BGX28_008693 [Mortierella sp. GBA30]